MIDPTLAERTCYLDGTWVVGDGAAFTSVEPGTGAELATWRLASVDQADTAVAAARRSFDDGDWRRRTPAERAAVLRRLADLIEREHEQLAQLVVAEVGSPISLARTLQTATPAVNFRWAAEMRRARAARAATRRCFRPRPGRSASESVLLREPIGVVTAITPYNYPINMISWKVAPALAAGCSVVLMPSPRGALCSVAFVRLAEEAGIPPGVLNLVPGDPAVGERLSSPSGRRHGDVHRLERGGRRRHDGRRADRTRRWCWSSAASRRR